jgi:ssDNA-binding Zn-finger/Zn-ribbon topoisomerase 1
MELLLLEAFYIFIFDALFEEKGGLNSYLWQNNRKLKALLGCFQKALPLEKRQAKTKIIKRKLFSPIIILTRQTNTIYYFIKAREKHIPGINRKCPDCGGHMITRSSKPTYRDLVCLNFACRKRFKQKIEPNATPVSSGTRFPDTTYGDCPAKQCLGKLWYQQVRLYITRINHRLILTVYRKTLKSIVTNVPFVNAEPRDRETIQRLKQS